jgi:hypothetical protein
MPKLGRRARLVAFGLLALFLALGVGARLLPNGEPSTSESAISSFLDSRLTCAQVRADAWSPLPAVEYTGALAIVLPASPTGAMAMVVGDDIPLEIGVETPDGASVAVARERLDGHGGMAAATPADYWLEAGTPHDAPRLVQSLTLDALPETDRILRVRLGRRAPRVLARLRDYPERARADVCALPVDAEAAFVDGQTTFVLTPVAAPYFATGWSEAMDLPGSGLVRWMGVHGALLIPSARRSSVRATLDAHHTNKAGATDVSLRVNDTFDLPPLQLRAGAQRYEWMIPASTWVAGTNELLLRVSAGGAGIERVLGFVRLELTLVP